MGATVSVCCHTIAPGTCCSPSQLPAEVAPPSVPVPPLEVADASPQRSSATVPAASARILSPILRPSGALALPDLTAELHPCLAPTEAELAPRPQPTHTYAVAHDGSSLEHVLMPATSKPLPMRVRPAPAPERRAQEPKAQGGEEGGWHLALRKKAGPSISEQKRASGAVAREAAATLERQRVAVLLSSPAAASGSSLPAAAAAAASSPGASPEVLLMAGEHTRPTFPAARTLLATAVGSVHTVSPSVVRPRFNLHTEVPKAGKAPEMHSGPTSLAGKQWADNLRAPLAVTISPSREQSLRASSLSQTTPSLFQTTLTITASAEAGAAAAAAAAASPAAAEAPSSSGTDDSSLYVASSSAPPSERPLTPQQLAVGGPASPSGSASASSSASSSASTRGSPEEHPLSLSQRPYALALQEVGLIRKSSPGASGAPEGGEEGAAQ